MEYLLCLDKMYRITLKNNEMALNVSDLMQMLDNMVDLIRGYGIDDSEILDNILNDTYAEIEEEK